MKIGVLVLFVVAGCLQAGARECPSGLVCPEETLCDPKHDNSCVLPEQLESCKGIEDGTPCLVRSADGVCDAEVCLIARCGDGYRVDPEDCDGSVPAAQDDCTEHGFHQAGVVGCTPDCTFDFSACSGICGDDMINGDEGCDGAELGDSTCRTFGFYGDAGLTCTAACTFNTAACKAYGYCGDGTTQMLENERCDGNLPAETCFELNYDAGSTTCSGSCQPALNTCAHIGWHKVSLPTGFVTIGMWGTSTSNVWAVGGGSARVMHFDGAGWTVVSAPGSATLNAVWGRSASEIYAVGDSGLMLKYDGTSWTTIPSVTTDKLRGVWGNATQIWAVGEQTTPSAAGTLVHHDGSTWTVSHIGTKPLYRVWGSPTNEFWAVGANQLLHYTGTWAQETPFSSGVVMSLWGTGPTDIWAGGFTSVDSGQLFHYDGTWTPVVTPFPLKGISTVFGSASNDVYATAANEAYHYDGTAWSREIVDFASGTLTPTPFYGFAADSTHAFLGVSPTIFEHGGSAWVDAPITSPTSPNADIAAMAGTSPSNVIGVGSGIWRFDGTGTTAAPMTSPTGTFLEAASASPDGVVFAAGDGGTVIKLQNGTWSSMNLGVSKHLQAIWAASAGDVWAAGQGALYHYTTAAGWQSVTVPGSFVATAIWGSSASNIWVGGPQSTFGHYDGASWTFTAPPGDMKVNRFWGAGASDVWAVDSFGIVGHFDGATWTVQPLSPTSFLGIHGTAADDIFAVTYDAIYHYDGVRWAPVRNPFGANVRDVWSGGAQTYIGGTDNTFGWLRRTQRWRCTASACAL